MQLLGFPFWNSGHKVWTGGRGKPFMITPKVPYQHDEIASNLSTTFITIIANIFNYTLDN